MEVKFELESASMICSMEGVGDDIDPRRKLTNHH
jgi:hypothetical protein